ncbi:MAG: hypothetical protein K6D90_01220 [Lachnospiraceae bacterium]|nr:hypothetical protein [Lachnospiraceae bacterium]
MEDRIEQMIWERINATIDANEAVSRTETEETHTEETHAEENAAVEEAFTGPNFILVESAEPAETDEPVETVGSFAFAADVQDAGSKEEEAETELSENKTAEAVTLEQDPDRAESVYVADPDDEYDITDRIKAVDDEEEIQEIKHWLFKENIRLRGIRLELQEMRTELEEEKRTQEEDRRIYFNHIAQERKQIHLDEEMVAEKLAIIKRGFAELDADRRELKEREQRLAAKEAILETKLKYSYTAENPEVTDALFLGVTSYLTLKKRYKDLMKMYHPDSMGGSTDMVVAINRSYDKLLKQYGKNREIL